VTGSTFGVAGVMTVRIPARDYWCDTGITLSAGVRYDLSAQGTWCDAGLRSDPGGNPAPILLQRIFARFLRMPGEHYFTLIGAFDRDPATMFPIRKGIEFVAPRSGMLTCFANDVGWAYRNNSGEVTLTVKQIGSMNG
jgi:hypothetical protein